MGFGIGSGGIPASFAGVTFQEAGQSGQAFPSFGADWTGQVQRFPAGNTATAQRQPDRTLLLTTSVQGSGAQLAALVGKLGQSGPLKLATLVTTAQLVDVSNVRVVAGQRDVQQGDATFLVQSGSFGLSGFGLGPFGWA